VCLTVVPLPVMVFVLMLKSLFCELLLAWSRLRNLPFD